jgi:transcriptional regulator with XRE-family HTH domain
MPMTEKQNKKISDEKVLRAREISRRIIAVREHLGLKKKEFAASIDKSPSYISIIESGKRIPAVDFFISLSDVHNVSLEYLFHGEGDMFKSEKLKDEREFIDDIEGIQDVVWLLENSPIARNAICAFTAKYFFDNELLLKKNVKRFRSRDKS